MRYLSLTDADRRQMLAAIGVASVEELYRGVPRAALLDRPLDLPRAMGELEIERDLQKLAGRNVPAGSVPSFLGCGAYRHHVPAAVDYLVQRGEFLTSYTPYQPEIAQGTLAGPLRVPDPGRAHHRHGCGERLALRRRNRHGRGGDDGEPPHAPAQGRARRQPPSALCRDGRDLRALQRFLRS